MKKIVSLILVLTSVLVMFGFNGDLEYLYGYDISKDASTSFQGIKSNIVLENDTGNIYYKLSMDFFSLNAGKIPSDLNVTSNIPEELKPFASLTNYGVPAVPYFLYNINEAFADIYTDNFTIRAGRFVPQSGSSTFYSPSVLIAEKDMINPFETMKTMAIDGAMISGDIGDINANLIIAPKTYDDIPSLYYPVITEKTVTEFNTTVSEEFSKEIASTVKESILYTLNANNATKPLASLPINVNIDAKYNMNNEEYSNEDVDKLAFENMNAGSVLSTNIMGFDVRAGFVHDHYHFIVPETVNFGKIYFDSNALNTTVGATVNYQAGLISQGKANSFNINEDVSLINADSATVTNYRPYRNSFTFDLQGVSNFIDSISYHAEGAVVVPEKTTIKLNYETPDKDGKFVKNTADATIFNDVYVKTVAGLEYTQGEDLTIGAEFFNGLPNEEFKDKLSIGGDMYIKAKISNISFEGLGLVAFSKINDKYEPGYNGIAKISYKGIDNFEPTLSINYAYAENSDHTLKAMEKLNNVGFMLKVFF
ncbi:hypothetical protein OSSY52_13170 [Tepiditoga spiralis]|uniref:Uncharacterized protein n=1 Tax=Tepiditoga spiralis TaxID=2108365 RepID=A0A7G1G758_9BACT|nr:hypothetical protein [Tepiditoga spiralis]BBE31176.1 hypothetical protein OSSY52_13170 [Tepiditoga spiralis]